MGPSHFRDVARFMLVNRYARELLEIADDALGYSLYDRFRDARGDYTEYAQAAFLVNCLALARWAEAEHGFTPDLVAGASFGGKGAAIHSGALDPADGIRFTAELARLEHEYFASEHRDVVTQSFARTPDTILKTVLGELDEQGEWYEISCYVDDDFSMLSLGRGKVEWLQQRLRALGGLPLYVMDPPMHAAAFAPLRDRVERELMNGLSLRDPDVPVVADQDGSVRTTAAGVRDILLDGIVRPVRWPTVVDTLADQGIGTLYMAGPDALFGRVACTTQAFRVVPADPRAALRPRRRS
ncbi:ACP S-malonyltransferase [Streptomyces sp. NPDC057293]|uniref:ACP S-malonyltransferase n=1 Tax=unclassified Streptomyces TaxID=2593676 RepID=UPI00363E01D9